MRLLRRLDSLADTAALGTRLAGSLEPGDCLALCGDLGAGKTELTRAIVAGLGGEAIVSSPTFTLVHEYPGGRLPVFHFDFYRAETASEILDLGWDDYLAGGGAVVAEWADRFPSLFPDGTRWLLIRSAGPEVREVFDLDAPPAPAEPMKR